MSNSEIITTLKSMSAELADSSRISFNASSQVRMYLISVRAFLLIADFDISDDIIRLSTSKYKALNRLRDIHHVFTHYSRKNNSGTLGDKATFNEVRNALVSTIDEFVYMPV